MALLSFHNKIQNAEIFRSIFKFSLEDNLHLKNKAPPTSTPCALPGHVARGCRAPSAEPLPWDPRLLAPQRELPMNSMPREKFVSPALLLDSLPSFEPFLSPFWVLFPPLPVSLPSSALLSFPSLPPSYYWFFNSWHWNDSVLGVLS